MTPWFGAGSTLGPFGNAGPAVSGGGAVPFNFTTGDDNVYGAGSSPAQSLGPVVVVGAVFLVGLWILAR